MMSAALVGVVAAAVAALVGLAIAGFRAADRPEDVTLVHVELAGRRPTLLATLRNPSGVAVLVGLSVRRCGVRLWLEGGGFVSLPRRTTRPKLLAARHASVAVAGAGETVTLTVPMPARWRRSVQLVAAIGQQDRLRVIHRRVALAGSAVEVA